VSPEAQVFYDQVRRGLDAVRRQRQIGIRELAGLMETGEPLSQSTVGKLFKGASNTAPNLFLVHKVLSALNVTLEHVVEWGEQLQREGLAGEPSEGAPLGDRVRIVQKRVAIFASGGVDPKAIDQRWAFNSMWHQEMAIWRELLSNLGVVSSKTGEILWTDPMDFWTHGQVRRYLTDFADAPAIRCITLAFAAATSSQESRVAKALLGAMPLRRIEEVEELLTEVDAALLRRPGRAHQMLCSRGAYKIPGIGPASAAMYLYFRSWNLNGDFQLAPLPMSALGRQLLMHMGALAPDSSSLIGADYDEYLLGVGQVARTSGVSPAVVEFCLSADRDDLWFSSALRAIEESEDGHLGKV